jgi:hypothetical protein
MFNPVAKNAYKTNKSVVYKSKKQYNRKNKEYKNG